MTSSCSPGQVVRRLLLVLVGLAMTACAEEGGTDYCMNHYRFHDDHRGSIGVLVINLSVEGQLSSDLTLPVSKFDGGDGIDSDRVDAVIRVLQQPQNVYSLKTAQECQRAMVNLSQNIKTIESRYKSDCGAENQVKQMEITLFDVIPEIEEIEATITTPATSKRFAINRQCERAIFRLE